MDRASKDGPGEAGKVTEMQGQSIMACYIKLKFALILDSEKFEGGANSTLATQVIL